jgi:hypothetical protein
MRKAGFGFFVLAFILSNINHTVAQEALNCSEPYGNLGNVGPIGAVKSFTANQTITVCYPNIPDSATVTKILCMVTVFDYTPGPSNYGCPLSKPCGSAGTYTNLTKTNSSNSSTYEICATYENQSEFSGSAILGVVVTKWR